MSFLQHSEIFNHVKISTLTVLNTLNLGFTIFFFFFWSSLFQVRGGVFLNHKVLEKINITYTVYMSYHNTHYYSRHILQSTDHIFYIYNSRDILEDNQENTSLWKLHCNNGNLISFCKKEKQNNFKMMWIRWFFSTQV